MPLVLDLHITHEKFGISSDPSISGHLHYPNDLDRPLNEAAADNLKYDSITLTIIIVPLTLSPLTTMGSTSGCLHSEFVRLLFLQTHRETDRFFAPSGVQLAQSDRGQFHYPPFSSQLKSKAHGRLSRGFMAYRGISKGYSAGSFR